MRKHIVKLGALAALLIPALATAAGITYGGSSTIADTVLKGGAIKAFEAKSGVQITIGDTSGTGKGLKELAAGRLDLAGAGRTLNAEEKKAGLLGVTVGYDGLAVYVNKANPVKDLSKEQLKDILTGKVTSWKQVGGKDVKIAVLVEPIASKRATVQLVQEQVMDGAAFGGSYREMEQLADQMKEVARNEGAICVASVGFLGTADATVKGGVRSIGLDATEPTDANIRSGAYLLSRPILFATKGLAAGDLKKFIDFMLSPEGQAIVERYFVAVKK
jgi:phosphate transport system substrate-binding protein